MPDPTPQVRRLDTPAALRDRLGALGCELPVADQVDALGPLACEHRVAGLVLHNRFAILPMEGWDGTDDGRPTDLVRRRWERFGRSGAALVWGGEAVAVRADGRANPHQLCIGPHSERDLGDLRSLLVASHRAATGSDPVVGLQLTHSGRWSRPEAAPAPRIAYRHPVLDERVGATDTALLSDDELDDLVAAFAHAAKVAAAAGFDFVDVKHCHGYLLHELLTAYDRPGRFGGSFEHATRFLRETTAAIGSAAPGLRIGVRLSAFDVMPHVADRDGLGVPETTDPYPWAFGGDASGLGVDLEETHRFCRLLVELGIELLCVTAGSPYWCPHVQRPAYFPPSDGYLPPHDPLVDVARMQAVTRAITVAHPELTVVGSGLTYLQDWFANVAQELVRDDGWMHSVGLGRMALSHPELPVRILAGDAADRRLVCRTFSDCTTAPRAGLVSGCWPLDDAYKSRPDRVELTLAKRAAAARRPGGTRQRGAAEDEVSAAAPAIRAGRAIWGASAVLLPFTETGDIDWPAFDAHVRRTIDAGLTVALNMDTGFGPFLDDADRRRVLDIGRSLGHDFIAGAHVRDEPGAAFDLDAYDAACSEIVEHGGTPIVFPSHGLAALGNDAVVDAHRDIARGLDRFLGFELGPMFHPAGRVLAIEVFEALLSIPQMTGLKHSSLRRRDEWDRLAVRDAVRPDFRLCTGNDLAIDMVVYGSDYLLGLSTFAPEAFGDRDAAWLAGDATRFWEINDLLQYLGQLAFRDPAPAYRHAAAMFLHHRGLIGTDRTHPRSPTRPASDRELLADISDRLARLMPPAGPQPAASR